MHTRDMVSTHPDMTAEVKGNVVDALIRSIEDCYDCAQTCTSCADSCLAEAMVEHLRPCIRLNLDCAVVCAAAGTLATRRTAGNEAVLRLMLHTCAAACARCAEECAKHAEQHPHCRVCAEACRQCEQSCRAALGSLGA